MLYTWKASEADYAGHARGAGVVQMEFAGIPDVYEVIQCTGYCSGLHFVRVSRSEKASNHILVYPSPLNWICGDLGESRRFLSIVRASVTHMNSS